MAESLNVIALISGGKDSFYSLLHCIQNGHKIVALGNLYPAPILQKTGTSCPPNQEPRDEDEHDLNSFMYQTVGHTVIPLYEKALGIPLYRQQIIGTAVQTGTSYGHVPSRSQGLSDSGAEAGNSQTLSRDEDEDETESLIPLLSNIMLEHPEANALSTGAILSTYQRTRVESIAIRLGLVPLAFLWQYPILPPGTQSSLLKDMQAVCLDARIVKVASGGLDESFLWQNVATEKTIRRVWRAMKRFGTDGDGAVLGEGGEFETLVIDGPTHLFKGRIEIKEEDTAIVREGGGSAWLRIREASVVMKAESECLVNGCREPSLLEPRFGKVLDDLRKYDGEGFPDIDTQDKLEKYTLGVCQNPPPRQQASHEMFTVRQEHPDVEDATKKAIERIQQFLTNEALKSSDIISTLIVLRSMQDFTAINKIYGSLFTEPNPPARVTIACGDLLPPTTNLLIQVRTPRPSSVPVNRQALHVQSRSYWAPANIGPYSQAISTFVSTSGEDDSISEVFIAGQIPLVPHTMSLPQSDFKLQAVLSLQHLWRIAEEMRVGWFSSVVAYLPCATGHDSDLDTVRSQAIIAAQAWSTMHSIESDNGDDDEDDRDLWEERYFAGKETRGAGKTDRKLPDMDMVLGGDNSFTNAKQTVPPFFAAEVDELPRNSMIEWHAHLGIVNGPVQLYFHSSELLGKSVPNPGVGTLQYIGPANDSGHKWSLYQIVYGKIVHSVLMIGWHDRSGDRLINFGNAMKVLCTDISADTKGFRCHTSYVDVKASEIMESRYCGEAIIPCRSLWGMDGKRNTAVLLFEHEL
ncbi:hypothetical protein EG329_001636 [Mollisiaceae sp. DMI_Dod_QoI]|nr:hypothetical protein EG329_001636 [Helotiales sp. DMI_Dod_QoI]